MDRFVYYNNNNNSNLKIEYLDVGKIEKEYTDNYDVLFIRINRVVKIDKDFLSLINLNKVGDEYENKICDRCYKYLDTEESFSGNRIKKNNVVTKRPSCKSCRKIIEGKSIKADDRRQWLKIKPINQLFDCPICNKISIAGLTKIVLDHDHSTGKVRGYLCESCNTGIGRFKDNIELLKNAIKWLEEKNS
tara:strand:+ start:939 stop:1508 length:570 start_codon:yes stop_codon:yes gene_type:complete